MRAAQAKPVTHASVLIFQADASWGLLDSAGPSIGKASTRGTPSPVRPNERQSKSGYGR
jgi:hypothetical protein